MRRSKHFLVAGLLLIATPLVAQETSLTVYADGRVLVRRTITVPVPRGASTVRVDLGVREVDPSSFVSLDDGVEVRGVRHSAALGLEGSLRRAVGHDLVFRIDDGVTTRLVTGRVLAAEPLAVRVDGQVMFQLPGTPMFPDSLVQLEPDVELTLEASRALSALRLLYASNGVSWAASYALMLPRGGDGQAAMTGNATIMNNAWLSLRGVEVQLVAGDVRRARAMPRDGEMRLQAGMVRASAQTDMMEQEGLSGTHLYTLPGRQDFLPGETRVIALFPEAMVAVEREFVLRAQGYGYQQEWPDAMRDQHPEIAYRVRRPAGSTSGSFPSTPLPGGVVRVYEPDAANRPQLAGEVAIAHTPGGRDLRLVTGTAFDVTATKVQTQYMRVNDRSSESTYRVEIQNAKAEAVTVLVTDQCPGRCEVLSSTVPAERGTATLVGFRVSVPAGGSATLEYRLRARW